MKHLLRGVRQGTKLEESGAMRMACPVNGEETAECYTNLLAAVRNHKVRYRYCRGQRPAWTWAQHLNPER